MSVDYARARFLIVQMMHHGDVLLTTALVDALKHAWSDCTVDMLVYQGMHDVLADNPAIHQVWTIDRAWKKLGWRQHLAKEVELANQIRAAQYDVVLNVSDRWRTALLSAYSGAAWRGNFAWCNRDHWLWRKLFNHLAQPAGSDTHVVEHMLRLLEDLPLPDKNYPAKVHMAVSEQSRHSFQEKLSAQGWRGEPYVLMHPASRWFFKCWDDDKTLALLQKLLDSGQNVVLTAAPDEREQAMLRQLQSGVRFNHSAQLWLLNGVLTLRELAAAIEQAQLFIGVDSVPMHMAAALDKPQVALFGASWVSRWRPYSSQAHVIWAGDYGDLPHPDSIDVNTAPRLLSAIPVEEVWQAVAQKLST